MPDQFQATPTSEAQLVFLFETECSRKEKILKEFEELGAKERRRRNPERNGKRGILKRKYERVAKGFFLVENITGNFIRLVDVNGKKLGALHVTSSISQLLKNQDRLEGVFGFRNGYWRVQFLFSLAAAMGSGHF